MAHVYENVIVPFDGTNEGRAGLAVAGDLAWRCGAKVVIVNNTAASGRASKEALKSRAMSLSGADVDFWVDADRSLGAALLEAAKFRDNPVICLSAKTRSGGVFSKRWSMPDVVEAVLAETTVPVLMVGPNTDTSRGLPMTEIVVATDGSPQSEQLLPLAAAWASTFKLTLLVTGVAPAHQSDDAAELEYLAELVDRVRGEVTEARFELVKAKDPAGGLIDLMASHPDAVLALTTRGRSSGRGPLGSVAAQLLAKCRQPLLYLRADS